jgi:hypothetical protein
MKLLAATTILCAATFGAFGADQNLPKAETILDKYLEVTGGKPRYEKLRTQVSSGTIELTKQGMSGTITIYRAFPNQLYTITALPIGTIEEGVDGETAWQKSPMMRPRIKQGQERASALRTALFNGDLRWRDQFASAEVVGVEKVGDHECYKILMTSKDSDTQTRYYDKNTCLLVELSMILKSPMGDVATETPFGDYCRVYCGFTSGSKRGETVRRPTVGASE